MVFSFFVLFCFSSCVTTSYVTTGFKDFYTPWYNENYFPQEAYLKGDNLPSIIQTSDLNGKFREISSQWYWYIGNSGFNGAELSNSEVEEALTILSKEKRAKIAIWSKDYTDTRNGVYSLPHTNYHSYTNSLGYANYYTTTTYSTHSYSVQRYDFTSYLFIAIPDDYKIIYIPGFSAVNLLDSDRETYKQNTGCLINIVYKNTTAYYANLFHGDIITEINGTKIYSAEDFFEYRKNANIGDNWKMIIIRNGIEKEINLVYSLY